MSTLLRILKNLFKGKKNKQKRRDFIY
jgi:hypothetical protein